MALEMIRSCWSSFSVAGTLAYVLAQLVHVAVGVGAFEVQEFLPDDRSAAFRAFLPCGVGGRHPVLQVYHDGMGGDARIPGQQFVQFLLSRFLVPIVHGGNEIGEWSYEGDGDEVILVFIDHAHEDFGILPEFCFVFRRPFRRLVHSTLSIWLMARLE